MVLEQGFDFGPEARARQEVLRKLLELSSKPRIKTVKKEIPFPPSSTGGAEDKQRRRNIRKYQKKVTVEAIQLTPETWHKIYGWIRASGSEVLGVGEGGVAIHMEFETPEGSSRAKGGDYVVRGVNGEFYPVKPDIFEKTYELMEGE